MPKENVRRKLTTIVVADVEGYSHLMHLDEEATLKTLEECREIFFDLIARHEGRVFNTGGDSVLAEFGSVVEAVRCAISCQEKLSSRNAELADDQKMMFRMGINIGDVMIRDGDLYGDDVNVAARLEGLAEAGGICVSSSVYDQVKYKLPIRYEDLGPRDVKNLSEPVHVFRVIMDDKSISPGGQETGEPSGQRDQPSIAILAFDNLSGDPDQDYFADGVVEEITAAISKVRSFFVVARNSSFAFKGKPTPIREVSQQLGVRYVLEGSIQKSGNRVRITAQLIDAPSDRHVWADKFDGTLEDIFDLQDQLVECVVGAVEPKLRLSEIERSQRKSTSNLNAYDCFLRALPHAHSMTQEGNNEALRLTSRAIALDPHYASAMALAAWCYTLRVAHGWVDTAQDEAGEALRLARAAIEIDKTVPENLWLAGYVLGFFGNTPEEGADLIDDALCLNPNSAQAWVYSGWLKLYSGDAMTAKGHFERALRLSPLDINAYRTYAGLAFSYLFLKQFDDAISWASKALHQNPKFSVTHRVLAASLGHADRLEEALEVVEQLQTLVPGFTVTRYENESRFRHPEYIEFLMDGMRKAGLPD